MGMVNLFAVSDLPNNFNGVSLNVYYKITINYVVLVKICYKF